MTHSFVFAHTQVKVVIVCTSASELKGYKTGVWLEECAVPYYLFTSKGFQTILASTSGGEIPIDAASLKGDFFVPAAEKFMKDEDAQKKLLNSVAIKDIKFDDVDAIYLAGGHGVCVDFVGNKTLKAAIETVYKKGKIVAADCHGPIALAECCKADGKTPLVQGMTVTGFTDSEENAVALTEKVPFLIEAKFKEQGAKFEKGGDWTSHIRVDGNLYTGQNPASSEALAEAVAKALA
uniref:DJ-1/PfpI domain-containing protein n=1 Tax=Amphora coffeiformis TaxID=265554 RepID=A0A7S3L657_9STRA